MSTARAASPVDDALAAWERLERRLRRPPSNVVRLPRRAALTSPYDFEAAEITEEDREEYALELLEAAGRLMDAGMEEAEADRVATADLGCVEFWQYARQMNAWCDEKRGAT